MREGGGGGGGRGRRRQKGFVGAQNIETSHQGDLRKTRHVKKITSFQWI